MCFDQNLIIIPLNSINLIFEGFNEVIYLSFCSTPTPTN